MSNIYSAKYYRTLPDGTQVFRFAVWPANALPNYAVGKIYEVAVSADDKEAKVTDSYRANCSALNACRWTTTPKESYKAGIALRPLTFLWAEQGITGLVRANQSEAVADMCRARNLLTFLFNTNTYPDFDATTKDARLQAFRLLRAQARRLRRGTIYRDCDNGVWRLMQVTIPLNLREFPSVTLQRIRNRRIRVTPGSNLTLDETSYKVRKDGRGVYLVESVTKVEGFTAFTSIYTRVPRKK